MSQFSAESVEMYPLSISQQNIWDIESLCQNTPINYVSTTLRIKGKVNILALEKSVQLVLISDHSLRTRITLKDKVPVQYYASYTQEVVPVLDFSQTSPEGITAWETAVTREIMPLLDAPLYRFVLFRVSEQEGGIFIKLHHIISDGWSQVQLCNRIGKAYLDLLENGEAVIEPAVSYETHLREEEAYLASSGYQRDKNYWESVFQQAGEATTLKQMKGAVVSPVGKRVSFSLSKQLNQAMYAFCKNNRVAPFSVFYMALAIYLKRIGGARRFTIGVPVLNRTNVKAKKTSGMFVSTLPFFCEVEDDWNFQQFNERLREKWFDLLHHQRFPFSHIRALSEEKTGSQDRLFHIAFSYQNSRLLTGRDASVTFSGYWHYSGYQMEQLCIHLNNREDERSYWVDYDYLTQYFSEAEIERLHSCLTYLLQEALSYPERPICDLPMLDLQEREQVLYTFNQSEQPVFETSLYGSFQKAAQKHARRAALICQGERLTYRELEEGASQAAALIEGYCGEPDALIAVLLPRDSSLFFAMMGILRAGGAFLLLPPGTPEGRLHAILENSGAKALITSRAEAEAYHFGQLPVLCIEDMSQPSALPPAQKGGDALAYVVYTSGSTGTPKGVEITAKNLLNLTAAMKPVYGQGAVLSVCSIGFDAFLLESIVALFHGRTIILPTDADLESAAQLAGLITGYGVGFLSTTPSRLSAYLKHEGFREAAGRLERIICGGEAVTGELLAQLEAVTGARIYNQYGPSETTVAVSMKPLNGCDVITAGAPMQNCKLYILDRWMNPLPVGIYGDLYIGGVCVGRGYRNAIELTKESFSDSPFVQGDRLYRTGDIGCWTPEGEIVLAGRSDHQVKLRGLRVEPEEVAVCLQRYPAVGEAAAAVKEQNGQPVLLAYYVSAQPLDEYTLLRFLSAYLPHYMIPAAVIQIDAIPLTPNGKVDDSRLPFPAAQKQESGTTTTPMEQRLLVIFQKVLQRSDLDANSDYFLHGGNSLNAMETLSQIAEETGCQLRVGELYICRTVRRLAQQLEGTDQTAAKAVAHLTPAPEQERYPLTPIQQGIYVQSHLDPTGRSYHMAGAFRLASPPDQRRLEAALQKLIDEQPLLRTGFVQEADGIFARLQPNVTATLPVISGGSFEEASAELLQPFALDKAPLLRVTLWNEKPGEWTLLLNMHHIIGDGLTTPVLMRRLDALYCGEMAQTDTLNYLDYAWFRAEQEYTEDLDYWSQRLTPLPEPLDIPADHSRGQSFDFKGAVETLSLEPSLSDACDVYCADHGISPFMFFSGLFGLLLSRLSGKEQMLIGTPVAGRLLPETKDMCGPFINTLPLRLAPTADITLKEYWSSVRDAVNEMLDHQRVGLEEIVGALRLPRTLSQSPLYQVIFSQRPLEADSFTLDGEPLAYRPIPVATAKMDLNLELWKEKGQYGFSLEYATSLFLPETAAFYLRCFTTLIQHGITATDNHPLNKLTALSALDQMELLETPRHTVEPFVNLPLHVMFARQLAMNPDAPAVVFHGETTSRRQLDQRANQIANLLVSAGVRPGHQVGIIMRRSMEMIAAVLAIWKTGCAYVPLLASYPLQRLTYMTQTADVTHLLCDGVTAEQIPAELGLPLVQVEQAADDRFEAVAVGQGDLAEVLFTSGSTGQPKGVMLAYRSIANMFAGFQPLLKRSAGPILCTTNVVFDMFNGETVMPLAMGKTIVMADDEEMMLPWRLAQLIERDGVTISQSTPSRVQMWLTNEAFCTAAAQLEVMIYGGEVLTPGLLTRAQAAAPHAAMINVYGPTEGTVYNSTIEVDHRRHINIGYPMKNQRLYVLDSERKPVLPTACGELYLAGECLSKGYISRPDLTAEAFFDDPFFPGERMYRTGDLVRLRLDGSYDFLGRRDAQVKLNGQRVELEEINKTLIATGAAVQAATVPQKHDDGSMELYTFYQPGEKSMTEPALRSALGKTLPTYMIPSHLTALAQLPYTPTGKIDLRALGELAAAPQTPVPEPQEEPLSLASTEPVTEPSPAHNIATTEDALTLVLTLWRRVLGRDIHPEQSFFEQGGTSLTALSILSQYHNESLVMSLAEFYENPTAVQQAHLFAPSTPVSEPEASPAASPLQVAKKLQVQDEFFYPARVPTLFPPYRSSSSPLPTRSSLPKTALLTGATGFLGAHLLKELLDGGVQKVICISRSGDKGRLLEILSEYFGSDWVARNEGAISLLKGDISQQRLGLTMHIYRQVSIEIEGIYHCAADVRHYAADREDFLRTNFTGTEHIIRLAQLARVPLSHMSTASIAGERLRTSNASVVFTERDFDIGQDWQLNLYIMSKFLAEYAVYEAIEGGLEARVYRLGRLVGRSVDGVFQRNPATNAFWLLMRGVQALGVIPRSMAQTPIELTPIDDCARAVLALGDGSDTAYHILNPTAATLEETVRTIDPSISLVSDEDFRCYLSRISTQQGDVISPLLDYWHHTRTSPPTIQVSNDLTSRRLAEAGFDPSPVHVDTLLKGFHFDHHAERGSLYDL